MMQYRLGVLGGMGPQATNTFYQFVIDRTDAQTDQEHVNALILSDSEMPDRTSAILSGGEAREGVYRRLLADARLLEGAGCTCIAVPCNTSHFFLDRVQEEIGIPILHMIRETARLLAAQGLKRPGILATDGTIQTGLYQKEFSAAGIEAVVPSTQAQELVMSLIYDDVKAGRDGDPQKFAAIHEDLLAQGCDCGVLACTELSVFADKHHLPPYYTDAMAVLAERAVEACHKPLRHIFIK
ncbi:MAG: amino acid racemase [Lawsonibacter sp.]|nr:amino acid racemase [Lawsonibacter sp.]MCI9027099.1 amino acid racemase [Lawsonibacter sp.]MCI9294272.1 amino acid racemase [Lawsonibacter sp.]